MKKKINTMNACLLASMLAGAWILLSHSSMNNSPMLVNLVTGQHAYITLPARAKIVREARN